MKYENPAITIDNVILKFENNKMMILLGKRKQEPYEGEYSLIGGFLKPNETVLECSSRLLQTKCNIIIDNKKLEKQSQDFPVWTSKDRDDRGWVITIPNIILVNSKDIENMTFSNEFVDLKWFELENNENVYSIKEDIKLGFDHKEILNYTIHQLKNLFETGQLEIFNHLFNEGFALKDISNIYDLLFNKQTINLSNFKKNKLIKEKLTKANIKKGYVGKPTNIYLFK